MARTMLVALTALAACAPAAAQVAAPPAGPPAARPPVARPGAPRVPVAEGVGEVSREAPINGILTLYGNQRCPTDRNGNEVVVCVRRGANEQYRIPKELRELQITEANRSWAVKAKGTLTEGVGASSIGSCSVVGPGGASGCLNPDLRTQRAVAADRRAAESPDLP